MHAVTSSAATGSPPGLLHCHRHDVATGVVRIALSGELDVNSGPGLLQMLSDAADDALLVVVDMGNLGFVDPAGAAALRAAARSASSRIVAVNVPHHVRRTLTILGVHRTLKLIDPPARLHGGRASRRIPTFPQ